MSGHDDTRDRLIALEVKVDHLTTKLDATAGKVDELHSLLMQARGARWAIIGVAALAGFISAKLGPLTAWLGGK